jgi:phosphoribosylanthranilate isomerase
MSGPNSPEPTCRVFLVLPILDYHLTVTRTRIKIDGICRPEDAAAAARAGADAVGIVLDPTAKRYVAPEDAGKILAAVPPFVTTVGIFVDAPADEIKSILRGLPFSAVQLHGNESPQTVADLKPVPVIKALHLAAGDTATLALWRAAIRDLQLTNLIGLLLETARPTGPRGGTGVVNDFTGLAEIKKTGGFSGLPPIILAGGLTPQNVAEAVRLLRPFAVDVSSGLESGHREKSAEKITAFIQAVGDADAK